MWFTFCVWGIRPQCWAIFHTRVHRRVVIPTCCFSREYSYRQPSCILYITIFQSSLRVVMQLRRHKLWYTDVNAVRESEHAARCENLWHGSDTTYSWLIATSARIIDNLSININAKKNRHLCRFILNKSTGGWDRDDL